MNLFELPRFLRKVDFPLNYDHCWMWVGSTTKSKSGKPYGQVSINGKLELAHRVMYEHQHGPIGKNLTVDHVCRNTLCVNPQHLRSVTLRDNILAGTGPSADAARRTACVNGHPLVEGNLVPSSHGWRRCRACKQISDRKRRKEGKAH